MYRAADSKLGRDVALKMLPPALAGSPERMARFRREAQVLASLNHPNIGAIYGLEEVDGASVLVLELVAGPTLLDRLGKGPVPVDEALPIALRIAEAVEYAHEKGIVHRDLKPANVKVNEDGQVKVLDFGLAKAMEDPAPDGSGSGDPYASPTLSPTLQSPITGALTGANVILGTAAYMSPEQARGKAIDRRSDIWSFGVILWEMLTGRRLFAGETVSDTLAAVLRKEPEWDELPKRTPRRIRQLLRRCLERNPRERLRDIGDARITIREVLSGTPDEGPEAADGVAPARRPWLLPVVALASAAVTAAVLLLARPAGEPAPLRKFATPFPQGTLITALALAPDASALAYVADGILQVRELTTLETRALASSSDMSSAIQAPTWSPDGEWIAYGAGTGLWKVRRSGGDPIRIATVHEESFSIVSGLAWRGRDLFFTTGYSSILRVPDQGGEPEEVVPLGEKESDFHGIADLGGDGFAFVVHGPEGFDTIDAARPDGSRTHVVSYPGEGLYEPAWSPPGYLLFRRAGNAAGIWAVRLSSELEASGPAFLVAPDGRSPSATADGTLAFVSGSHNDETQLALVNRSGALLRTIGDPARFARFFALSPDEGSIACRIMEGEIRHVWLIDIARGSRRRFTHGAEGEWIGEWDPSGREFYYSKVSTSVDPEIFRMAATGTGDPEVVTRGQLPQVSPDGRWLLFTRVYPDPPERDLWLLDLSRDDAEPQPFIDDPGLQWSGVFAPAAPLVAYNVWTEERGEVYLTTYPERRGDWPVTVRGGLWPAWRGDGHQLYYAEGDSIMVVDVDTVAGTPRPRLSTPRLLFRRPRYAPESTTYPDGFAVMSDGETFVMNVATEAEVVPPAIVVTQHWRREFRDGG